MSSAGSGATTTTTASRTGVSARAEAKRDPPEGGSEHAGARAEGEVSGMVKRSSPPTVETVQENDAA